MGILSQQTSTIRKQSPRPGVSTSTAASNLLGMDIRARTTQNEGRRKHAYLDSKLIWTTGVGFNLQRAGAKAALAKAGVNYDMIWAAIEECKKAGGGRKPGDHTGDLVTDAQIDQLLTNDIAGATADAKRLCPAFDTWPETAKMVLVDLVFNVGASKLGGWAHTMGAFRNKDWKSAADNLSVTQPWRGQVGKRADDNIAYLRSI